MVGLAPPGLSAADPGSLLGRRPTGMSRSTRSAIGGASYQPPATVGSFASWPTPTTQATPAEPSGAVSRGPWGLSVPGRSSSTRWARRSRATRPAGSRRWASLSLWIPESVPSREIFAHATLLLEATERLIVATGIANLHARDAVAMANGARLLADAFPGRFVLGIGVSHKPARGTARRRLRQAGRGDVRLPRRDGGRTVHRTDSRPTPRRWCWRRSARGCWSCQARGPPAPIPISSPSSTRVRA